MTPVAEKLQPWLAAVEQRPQGGPRWLQDLRDRAATRFAALGFPTARDEEWRFTSVAPIAAAEFRPTGADAAHATEAELAGYLYSDAAVRIVIVNGRLAPELSRTANLPEGVRVGSLAAAVTEQADVVQRYLGQLADFGSRAFTALNTALASDGAYVYIPDGVILEQPLHILFVTTGLGHVRPDHVERAGADRRRRPDRVAHCRDLRRTAGDHLLHERRHRGLRGRERDRRSLQGPAGERRGVPHREHAHPRGAQRRRVVALVLARRKAGAQRRERAPRRGRRGVHPERPVPGRRRPARRQPHDDRSRQGALPEPRDLQGHPRRQGPGGVQRQDHRAPGRAEDRREADQPRAAALRRRGRSTPSRSSRSSPTT